MKEAANRQKLGDGMRKRFLIVCMALAGILLLSTAQSVQAAITSRIDLVDTPTNPVNNTGVTGQWAWDKVAKTLTLEDESSLWE